MTTVAVFVLLGLGIIGSVRWLTGTPVVEQLKMGALVVAAFTPLTMIFAGALLYNRPGWHPWLIVGLVGGLVFMVFVALHKDDWLS
jgi:hypothetical protein